ncbi:taurine transporter ATP-binding subunit [Yersinia enterocolitica]|nr:taurine transporter ATP-binding subunit [Yersinia enterocolitica]
MLNVSGLWAEYQGKPALQDVSLQIASGQLVVVLGPSGCGKTTLLNLIAGFMEPSAGSITLDDIPVHGPSAERGVVFQHEGLLPWRDVVSNVEFGLQLAGLSKQQRRTIALKILNRVGLAGFEHHYIWQLSGGMRQRVGIARALAVDRVYCCSMSRLARWMLLLANRCKSCC